MQKLIYGDASAELVPTCEKLCKARVLRREWEPARTALELAHSLCMSRHGAEHRDTLRIGEVLASLEQYAPRE